MRFTLLALIAFLAPWSAHADFLIVGSDLSASAVQPPLEAYAKHHEITINTHFIGSVPAVTELQTGKADLAILAAPSESDLPTGNFRSIPFAYEVAFVVVGDLNPLTEISLADLAAIYGSNSEADFNRWGELGVQGPLASRSIQPLILDSSSSVVMELFKYRALGSGSLKPNVSRVADNLQLNELVASDTGAIAVTKQIMLADKLRALSVSGGTPGQAYAFGPTPENVHYGDYPLRLNYYLVYPRERQAELLDLLRFLLGPDEAEALRQAGFVPVPENVRKRTLLELDKAK